MEQKLLEIIAGILKLQKDDVLAAYDDKMVWDSLHRVEILFAIEDELDISFDQDELKELDTPQKLVAATLEKLA